MAIYDCTCTYALPFLSYKFLTFPQIFLLHSRIIL